MKKYELTDIKHPTLELHRIRALIDIPSIGVKAGDLGGYVEGEHNLSQDGDCWIFDDARVTGQGRITGRVRVTGRAWVFGPLSVADGTIISWRTRLKGGVPVGIADRLNPDWHLTAIKDTSKDVYHIMCYNGVETSKAIKGETGEYQLWLNRDLHGYLLAHDLQALADVLVLIQETEK